MSTPVVIELALNGATPRSRNRHVPRTPAEIAEAALEGVALGASIVHNHNDDPMFTANGVHAVEPYLQAWRPVLDRYPDVLLYPTMAAGARGIPVHRRWHHVEKLAPMGGMTLVDPGSVNVGLTSDGGVPDDAAPGPYRLPGRPRRGARRRPRCGRRAARHLVAGLHRRGRVPDRPA